LPAETFPQLLHPGQQASTNAAGTAIAVPAVAVEQAVAWKNGYFE
jgi:ferric-dicitrate binding protein FerR (iron transport regulator)